MVTIQVCKGKKLPHPVPAYLCAPVSFASRQHSFLKRFLQTDRYFIFDRFVQNLKPLIVTKENMKRTLKQVWGN
jgi:hypothetical protein